MYILPLFHVRNYEGGILPIISSVIIHVFILPADISDILQVDYPTLSCTDYRSLYILKIFISTACLDIEFFRTYFYCTSWYIGIFTLYCTQHPVNSYIHLCHSWEVYFDPEFLPGICNCVCFSYSRQG